MKLYRRLVVLSLTLMITISFMPSFAFAEGELQGNDFDGNGAVVEAQEEEQSAENPEVIADENINAGSGKIEPDDAMDLESIGKESSEKGDTSESDASVTDDVTDDATDDAIDVSEDTEPIEETIEEGTEETEPDEPEVSYPVTLLDSIEYLDAYSIYIDDDDDDPSTFTFSDKLRGNEAIYALFELYADDSDDARAYDVDIRCMDGNGKTVNSLSAGDYQYAWISIDRSELGTDDFYITLENTNSNVDYTVYCTIKKYKCFAEKVKIPTTLNLKTEASKTLSVSAVSPVGSLALATSWKSSDKKIATVNSEGKVTAKAKGTCYVTVKTVGGATAKCKVVVTNPSPRLNYKKLSLYKGNTRQLKLKYTKKKVKWSTSNKKIATVSKNGKVTAKKVGKCTITATAGGKKYKCKVTVSYRECDFGAVLWDYDTRGNYFVVKYRNLGSKPLTITSGIKVKDVDYKSFDRKIKLKKKIKIKPNTTKFVRFYVKGRTTWPDYEDFTLFYKFNYDGKVYEGHVWDEDSVYKKGKKWYCTYFDDDWYENWY